MTTDRLEVHIELDGQTVPMGEVELVDRRGRTVRSEFAYRSSYLARSGVPALDPATRLDAARHVTDSLPRGLGDAGPDGWGRRLILRALRGQVPSEADFLLAVDDFSRIGALRLRADADGPFLSERHDVPQLIDLEALAAAAERVEVDADDMAAVRQLLDPGTASLGGARPKASVADGERLLIAKGRCMDRRHAGQQPDRVVVPQHPHRNLSEPGPFTDLHDSVLPCEVQLLAPLPRRPPQAERDMARGMGEVSVDGEQRQLVLDGQLRNERVDRGQLDAHLPALVR